MYTTLQKIDQLKCVMTLCEYLSFLQAEFDQNNIFFQTTLICSTTHAIQRFPLIKPSNFLFQKLIELQKKENAKQQRDKRYSFDINKKPKCFIGSNKLLLTEQMENLYKLIGDQNFEFLFEFYKILVKEDFTSETYIQINGTAIMEIVMKQKSKQPEKIQRQQILYCNHMSRQVGLFKKNFISNAKQEIIKSKLIEVTQINQEMISIKATSNIIDTFFFKIQYKQAEKEQLRKLIQQLVNRMQKFNFPQAFKIFVSLPKNYTKLKNDVKTVIKQNTYNTSNLFDELYKQDLSHDSIIAMLRYFLRSIVPTELFGERNFFIFLSDIEHFIKLLRFEDQNYNDYLYRMNILEIPWLCQYYSKKKQRQIIATKRIKMLPILKFLFQQIIIPFLRHNFYITERMKDDWKLFYYRKEIWHLIVKLSLNQLTQSNYKQIPQKIIQSDYVGKLRLVPKPGTFRPIVTYNRKSRITKLSLNKSLLDVKYILRNLKNQKLGYSVFGNPQIFNRLEEFKNLWIKLNFPKVYFMTMDVQKCYDSIQLQYLLRFIEESDLIYKSYLINKYYLITRNNRQLKQTNNMKGLFNIFDRTCAIPSTSQQLLQKGYIEHIQKSKLAIIANQGLKTIVSFSDFLQNIQAICKNNIVQFENNYYLQVLGIPQGLNVSGILCSFYIANIEKNLTKKIMNETLIMRLTDDYCCLTFNKENLNQIYENFKDIEKQYKIYLNDDKTQNNLKQDIKKFKWIGKIIDLQKLTIKPAFYLEKDSKFKNQINVNLPNKITNFYLKSKLKSLILNQFKFFFNHKINDFPTLIKTLKIFIHAGLIKLIPFIEKAEMFRRNRHKNKNSDFLIKIIKRKQKNQDMLKSVEKRIRIRSELYWEHYQKAILENNQIKHIFEINYQLQKNMNQQFYNFLTIPITQNIKPELVKVRLAKQFIVAQVLYIFNTWQQLNNDEPIILGIIGCGQVGKLIINSLIPYAMKFHNLKAENVHISTRRPEQIYYYVTQGYQVYFDNDKLLSQCNFVVMAIPPVIDNWNILELSIKNPKQYRISLLSTLKLERLKQLLKLNKQIYHTQISAKLLDNASLSYIELIESTKPGVFQTQIQEDILKLITEQGYANFVEGKDRIDNFLDSFEQPLNESQYQKIFGRNKQEFDCQKEKLFKMSFAKSILQFQNFIQKQLK